MDSVDPMSSLRREKWGALGFVLVSKIEQRVFWIGIILLHCVLLIRVIT